MKRPENFFGLFSTANSKIPQNAIDNIQKIVYNYVAANVKCAVHILSKGVTVMGKFIIKETKTGYTFSLKAGNGEVIATGGEVYNSLASIKNGIASVSKNAPIANIEDQTEEGFAAQTCPKFEIYTDKAGEFRFRLKAKNGQIISVSEGYVKKDSCKNGIESVRKNAVDAPVVEPEPEK